MKIAIIKKAIPTPSADIINTLSLAQGLYNLNHEVEVLGIKELKNDLWKSKIGDIHRFFDLNYKIKIKYFKGSFLYYFRKLKLFRGIINFLTLFPKLHNRIDPEIEVSDYCIKNRFDLVICRDTFKAAYKLINSKIHTIIDIHGYRNIYEADYLIQIKDNDSFRGILTLNDFLKQKLINFGFPEKKIKFMDNAIDIARFDSINYDKIKIRKKLNLSLNKIIILYSGTLQDDRGIDTILYASEILNKKKFSFYFIGGNNRNNNKWKKFLLHKKIKSDVHFLGMRQKRIVPYYLKAADVLLATFNSNCPTLDFMSPVKIIEYMASKTPFIATKIGRNIDICNNNECLFVKPDDPIDLCEKINLLVNNTELQKKLIENAYNKAKNQTFKKKCEMIIELSS